MSKLRSSSIFKDEEDSEYYKALKNTPDYQKELTQKARLLVDEASELDNRYMLPKLLKSLSNLMNWELLSASSKEDIYEDSSGIEIIVSNRSYYRFEYSSSESGILVDMSTIDTKYRGYRLFVKDYYNFYNKAVLFSES